jgi:hypothetical protein
MKEIIEFWMSKDKDAFDGFSEESFDWFLSDLYVNLNGGLQNVKEGDTVIKCMSRVRNRTEFTPVNVVHTEPDFIYVTFLADVLRKSKYNRETGICESGPGTGWIITDNRQGGLDAGNLLLVVNE